MKYPVNQTPRPQSRGFTLVELLAVMGIMVIMTAFLIPALGSITGSKGRQGAINQLMGSFDRARVAALESSSDVTIAFADATFPVESMRYRSFIIFRPRLESDIPSSAQPGANPSVFLSDWQTLPQGLSLKSEPSSLVGNNTGSSFSVPGNFPMVGSGRLPTVVFNSSGAIASPVDTFLQLLIYEGFHTSGRDVFTSPSPLFDKIVFSRYTGRARLEVSAKRAGGS